MSQYDEPPVDVQEEPSTAIATRSVHPQAVSLPEKQPASQITAAQAKVDAIAKLTMSAYERAATLELTKEESDALMADFPDDAFQRGAAGKQDLIYIEHSALRDRMNRVFGMGKWALVPRARWNESFTTGKGQKAERVYVEAMLVIRGCFAGEAVGDMVYYPNNDSQNYGDAVEGAKTAAFRRCAKEFGIGLQAWSKSWCAGWWQRQKGGTAEFRPAPKPAAPAPAPTPAPMPTKPTNPVATKPKEATEATKAWAIKGLMAGQGQPNREAVKAFFVDKGWILPTEEVERWPLYRVPTTTAALAELADAISGLGPENPATPEEELTAASSDDGRPSMIGTLEQISEKSGTKKNGQTWTLFGLKVGDAWYNTFDSNTGEAAKALKGQNVRLFYETTERGNNATGIEAA